MKSEKKPLFTRTSVVFVFFAILLLWLGSFFVIHIFSSSPEREGQFGDTFGAINALFSGMAFAGIIFTILLQRNELELQREELELTRKEMEKSADALTEQVKSLNKTAAIHAHSAIIQYHAALAQRNFDQHAAYGSNMREANWHINQIQLTGEIDKPKL